MSGPSIAFGVPVGVAAEPVLHPACEIWLWGSQQNVNVIGHPAIGDDPPAASVNLGNQSFGESFVVLFVVKQFPTSIAAGDDMVGTRRARSNFTDTETT